MCCIIVLITYNIIHPGSYSQPTAIGSAEDVVTYECVERDRPFATFGVTWNTDGQLIRYWDLSPTSSSYITRAEIANATTVECCFIYVNESMPVCRSVTTGVLYLTLGACTRGVITALVLPASYLVPRPSFWWVG